MPALGVRQACLRLATWSVLSMLAVAGGAVVVGRHVAETQALELAAARTAGLADGVVAPLVDRRVRAGHRPALSPLEGALRSHIRSGTIAHIRLWDSDGTVIWCDQGAVAGRGLELDPSAADLFALSDVSFQNEAERETGTDSATRTETAGATADGHLQVHVGVRDSDGVPLVVEAHLPRTSVTPEPTDVIGEVAHLGLGGLLLLLAGVVPLTVRVTRQLGQSQRRYDEASQRALVAAERERRRIAKDLHDGPVQELAGLGYALPALTAQVASASNRDLARATAAELVAVLHRNVAALRSLLVELYPPDLEPSDLPTALERLAAEARRDGLEVEVTVDGQVPDTVAETAYRVVREGLLNVRKHACAAQADVTVVGLPEGVVVSVVDDGVGLGGEPPEPGHMGLRLLAETLGATGGGLTLDDRPEGGAALTARVPLS